MLFLFIMIPETGLAQALGQLLLAICVCHRDRCACLEAPHTPHLSLWCVLLFKNSMDAVSR